MLPKITKTQKQNRKTKDSESKAEKEDKKSIDLEFNAEVKESSMKERIAELKNLEKKSKFNEGNDTDVSIEDKIAEVKSKNNDRKRQFDCNTSTDLAFTAAENNTKLQSLKIKKNSVLSTFKSNVHEVKRNPKRRRIIYSDSSDTEVEEEYTHSKNDFIATDDNNDINKFKNTVIQTDTKKYVSEVNLNDKLGSKCISNIQQNNIKLDKIKTVISKSDSESKVLKDDENWNHKSKRTKLQSPLSFNSTEEENHKSSESDSQLVEVAQINRASDRNRQHKKSEANSVTVTDSNVLGSEFSAEYKCNVNQQHDENSISLLKQKVDNGGKKLENNCVKLVSDIHSIPKQIDKKILNHNLPILPISSLRLEAKEKSQKLKSYLTEVSKNKSTNSKLEDDNENTDSVKENTNTDSDYPSSEVSNEANLRQEFHQQNSISVSKCDVNQQHGDKSISLQEQITDKRKEKFKTDSEEVVSGNNLKSILKKIDNNNLACKLPVLQTFKVKPPAKENLAKLKSDLAGVTNSKSEKSKSIEDNKNTSDADKKQVTLKSNLANADSNVIPVSKSEEIDQNTLNSCATDSSEVMHNNTSDSTSSENSEKTLKVCKKISIPKCKYDAVKQHKDKITPLLKQKKNKKGKELKPNFKKLISNNDLDPKSKIISTKSQRIKSQKKITFMLEPTLNKKFKKSTSDLTQETITDIADLNSEEVDESTYNKCNLRSTRSRFSKVDCIRPNSETDIIDPVKTEASNSQNVKKKRNKLNKDSQKATLQRESMSKSTKSVNSKNLESESKKHDKTNLILKSQKNDLKNKSGSLCLSPQTKRKLINESDTPIDIIRAEDKLNSKIGKLKKSGEIKKTKFSVLDPFYKKYKVTEDKGSETSDVSDFVLELEDEEEKGSIKMDSLDIDFDEDDWKEMGDNGESQISYWPTDEEFKKLKAMRINLQHEVPPQHLIESNSGTRNLSKKEKQQFEQYITLKEGTFSVEENQILQRNWTNFCLLHDWNHNNAKPFLHMRFKNKSFFLSKRQERMKFVQFLASGLFDRSLYSVYNRFKIIFEPHKVSRYTAEEDNTILDFINKSTKSSENSSPRDRKFADLALILKRTRASVWRRYQVLQKKQKKKKKKTRNIHIDDLEDSD